MKPLAQYQEVAVTKFFGLLQEGAQRILEIGSDVEYAVVDNIAARFSGTVTGINPAPGFVKRTPQEGPQNVTILEADGCNMPFDDKSFDAILSIATMEHVLDVPKFLEESHRVLKPGGVFYTNFSPIWSSGIGHHVCAFAGRKEARFWKPGRNPLPDFSHLLWAEEEMREYLLESPYDDRLIDPIIDWVYRSGNINRCFYEDYLEAFRESRLTVSAFVPGIYKSPSPELLDALRAKHGRHREFSHDSIEAILSRPSLSSRLQQQHAAASLQPPAPEMKADKCSKGDTITMTRPTSRSAGTDNAAATTSRAALPQHSPQRCLSPEELFVMTNRRLGQFRNRHKGQRCVIIGNGPSLNKMDLSFLENEITFGMNRIFLLFDKWKFRPTYYVSVNPLVIEQSAEDIRQIDAPKFLSHKGIPFFNEPGDINFLRSVPQWFFSKDPRNGICEGWTVTYVAMQLAYFMGFDEVILIGVDHHFVTQGDPNKEVVSEGDDPNHFHPGYFGKGTRWHLPDLERSEGSYQMAKQAFEAENRRILDATVDGKLAIFPKADYRELFHQTNRQCTDIPLAPADQRINESSGDEASCKISVITPSFNQGGYIEQTIRSVMAQNYPNHEHIIIDGGSDDDTVNILKRYTHIRWLSEKDRGQSDAINKGFRMATGDIIAWINSDDWYEPGTFSLIADFFHRHPDRNVVMGNCNLVDEHGVIFDTVVNHERGFDELKQHWVPRSIPTQPAIFFRRRLLDEFGLLDESLHYAMDYDLWMRFAQRNRFHHLDVTVANYRFHSAAKGGDHDWSKFLPDCKKVVVRYAVPRVSVVVPCYNYGRYLTEAVGSVLTQTFQDFEIIIVNDGSTDNTLEVADKIMSACTDGRIRLINQTNSGDPALARNRGISEARGEFILCLDADDMIMPEFLHQCVMLLDKVQDIAIAYTDQIYFGFGKDRVVRVADYEINCLAEANFMGYCSLFRKKVWEEVGGYPSGIGYEDWDFWLSCGEKRYYGRRIPQPLFCYRQHDSGRYVLDKRRDAEIKARIVLKHPTLYGDRARREAEELLRGEGGNMASSSDRLFRVIALISAHNEGDVIYHVIGDLVSQGIEVYLINHCSTDNTIAEASRWLGKGLLHIENFPQDACYPVENTTQYIWHHILRRKEELATQLEADWFIHSDADEFRESPWPGLTLKQAIQVADSQGYNALNFELLNFRPVNNSFTPGSDVREALLYYELSEEFNSLQIKAWKNLNRRVDLVSLGGHDVAFEGKRVFPVKFLLRHYPIRSQEHGLRKVFAERKNRFNAVERNAGWHIQYDAFDNNSHKFLYDKSTLTLYDADAVRLRILGATIMTAPAHLAEYNCETGNTVLSAMSAQHSEGEAEMGGSDTSPVKISIIIPLFNKVDFTRQCLEGLAAYTGDQLHYEVIVVDNASSDGTADYLKSFREDLTVVTNKKNLGFACACNQGARLAASNYLVFLNNDTIPKEGWLEALTDGIEQDGADICGARLLYPNGKVQHAGVAFNEQGIGYHIFNGFDADASAVTKKRFMQCVTAACMIIRRELFHSLSGFDEGYVNGYEDVDLCLRAGELGKKILYAPDSTLIHFEETSEGRKAHDEPNARRFLARWGGKVRCDDNDYYRREGYGKEVLPDGRIRVSKVTADQPQLKSGDAGRAGEHGVTADFAGSPAEKGVSLKLEHRYEEALGMFSVARKRGDTSVLAHMGDCLANLGKPGDAEAAYREALSYRPDDVAAQIGMGVLKLMRLQYVAAAAAFGEALKGEPGNAKALSGLGLVNCVQGKDEEAFACFSRALDSDPENLTALGELVKCAYRLERFDGAERHLENYLRYHPADLDMLFSLAGVLLKMEKSNEALEALETILLFDPKFEEAWEMQQMIDKKLPIAV